MKLFDLDLYNLERLADRLYRASGIQQLFLRRQIQLRHIFSWKLFDKISLMLCIYATKIGVAWENNKMLPICPLAYSMFQSILRVFM